MKFESPARHRKARLRHQRQADLTVTLGLMVLVLLAALIGSHYADVPSPTPHWVLPLGP